MEVPPSDPLPRLVTTRVGPIAITEEGDPGALAVLCVHGLPGSRRDFRYLAPLLARDLRVVRVEMPGFGASPAGALVSLPGWGRALRAVGDALDLSRYVLLSHSFGSGGALFAAAEAPERVKGMVLLAPMGLRRHRAFSSSPRTYRIEARGVAIAPLRPLLTWLARRAYERLRLRPPRSWQELRLHLRVLGSVDFRAIGAAARRAAMPALVAHCRDDPLVEVEIASDLVKALPRGELVEYDSGGHHLQKTRAPQLAAEIRCRLVP